MNFIATSEKNHRNKFNMFTVGKLLSAIVLVIVLIQSSFVIQEVDAAIMQQSTGRVGPCRMYRYIDDRFECVDQLIYELANIPMNDLDADGGKYTVYHVSLLKLFSLRY